MDRKLMNLAPIVLGGLVILLILSSAGYLSVVPLGEDVYVPHYAYVECVEGQSVSDSQPEVYVPEETSSQILYCGYESCDNIEIDATESYMAIFTVDGVDYKVCYNINDADDCYTTWQTGGRDSYSYKVSLPITLAYMHTIDAYSPDSAPITVQDNHFKVYFNGNKAILRTGSSDPVYEGHQINEYNCDPGEWNQTEKQWFEGQYGHAIQYGDFDIGQREYFVANYMREPIAIFQNGAGEYCFNDKAGWTIMEVNGYKFLDTNSSTRNVEACSSSECQALHGGDTAWFVTDDWTCTTNADEAQECTTDQEAGGLRCENKQFVYYSCEDGKIVRTERGDACCSSNADCAAGETCANNVCVSEGAVSYETCNEGQCCIGFMDDNYDESLNSIYEHGRYCPEGTYCSIKGTEYLGTCLANPPEDTEIEPGTSCGMMGATQSCSVGNEPGVQVCMSNGEWSECRIDYAKGRLTVGQIILGAAGLFGALVIFKMFRRK